MYNKRQWCIVLFVGGELMSPKVSEEYKFEKKKEIVQSSIPVFIEKGFIHVSMQDVMDKVEISRGALYSYFTNIEDIFIEVLKYEDKKDIHYFVTSEDQSQWIQLKKWIQAQQSNIENINESLVHAKAEFFLSSNYANDKKNYPYIAKRYEQMVTAIEEILNNGVLNEEFQIQQSARSIARYLISFINGLMLDTFQLGHEKTEVRAQLSILCFTLEKLLNPVIQNEE